MGTPFFVLSGGLAAWGKGLPSASRLRAGHVPPAPPACGPTPCPPCAAAVPPPAPSSPLRGLAGEMWRPRPRLRRVLVKLAASRCAGAPLRKARPRQAACGGPCFAPPPRRLRRRCSGAARPPLVGALGPSAPPARSAALRPALPARPRLRRRPCRSALPTHSPPGVAARGPSLGVPPPSRAGAPAAGCCCSPCPCGGPQFRPPRALAAQAPPSRAFARGGARGTPPAGGSAGRCPGRQGQGKPRAGRQAAHRRGPCLPVPRPAMGKRGGCPALCGPPAPSHSGKRWCFYVCCCLSCLSCWPGLVAGLPSWWCLWLVAVPACSVALALCFGGGFCLSAGGGVPWAFLACWCFCRSAGCCSVRVAAPLWVLSLASGCPRSGCCPLPVAAPALGAVSCR